MSLGRSIFYKNVWLTARTMWKTGEYFKKVRIGKGTPPFSGLYFLIRHHIYLQKNNLMREAEFFLYHRRIRRYAVLAIPESLPREKNLVYQKKMLLR